MIRERDLHTSDFVTLNKDLFPKNSVGQEFWPDVITGRMRNVEIFQTPFNIVQAEESFPIERIFAMPIEEFNQLTRQRQKNIERGIKAFAMEIAIGPEGNFIRALRGDYLHEPAISIQADAARVDFVLSILETENSQGKPLLTEDQKQLLKDRFGLVSGIPKSLAEIASLTRTNRETIRQQEAKALRVLRKFEILKEIKRFVPLKEDIIAREFFGVTCTFDLEKHLERLADIKAPDFGLKVYSQSKNAATVLLQMTAKEILENNSPKDFEQFLIAVRNKLLQDSPSEK